MSDAGSEGPTSPDARLDISILNKRCHIAILLLAITCSMSAGPLLSIRTSHAEIPRVAHQPGCRGDRYRLVSITALTASPRSIVRRASVTFSIENRWEIISASGNFGAN